MIRSGCFQLRVDLRGPLPAGEPGEGSTIGRLGNSASGALGAVSSTGGSTTFSLESPGDLATSSSSGKVRSDCSGDFTSCLRLRVKLLSYLYTITPRAN